MVTTVIEICSMCQWASSGSAVDQLVLMRSKTDGGATALSAPATVQIASEITSVDCRHPVFNRQRLQDKEDPEEQQGGIYSTCVAV